MVVNFWVVVDFFFFLCGCWFVPMVDIDVVTAVVVVGHCCGSGGGVVVATVVEELLLLLSEEFNILF